MSSSPRHFPDWPPALQATWRARGPKHGQCRSLMGQLLAFRRDVEGPEAPLAERPAPEIVASFLDTLALLTPGSRKVYRSALRRSLEAVFPGDWEWVRRRRPPVAWPAALQDAFAGLGLPPGGLGHSVMSRLLQFRADHGDDETLSQAPATETVGRFLDDLEQTLPASAQTYRLALREVLAQLFPERDWAWMLRRQRTGLPFADWPAALRQAWAASGLTSLSIRASVGQLLAYYDALGIDRQAPPTPEILDGFIDRLRKTASAEAVEHCASDLFYGLGAVHPPRAPWRWVKRRYAQPPQPRAAPKRPRRHSVGEEAWPPAYLERWRAAEAAGFAGLDLDRLLDADAGELVAPEALPPRTRNLWRRRRKIVARSAGKYWRPSTRRNVREALSLFLGTARQADLPPKITPTALRAFVHQCEARNCSLSTIHTRVMRLYMAAHVVEPGKDWRWIGEIARALGKLLRAWELDPEMVGKTSRRKVGLVVNAAELWLLGEQLMQAARAETANDLRAALLFRDGLILCILASAPVRVGAFARTTIDGHLLLEDEGATIAYSWTETKQKRGEVRHLPAALAAVMREWITEYRSRLVRDASEMALWLSLAGTPLTGPSISRAIANLTEAALGVRISAHRIRDVVVSTIAERAPAKMRIGREILQHAQDGTVRIYDQHASQIEAARQVRHEREALIDDIRRRLRQEGNREALRSRPLSDLHATPKRHRRRRGEFPALASRSA